MIGEGSRVSDRTGRIVESSLGEELQIGNFLLDETSDLDARLAFHADWDLECVTRTVGILESPDVVWAAVEGMAPGVQDEGGWVFRAVDEGGHEMDVVDGDFVDFHDVTMCWRSIWLYLWKLERPTREGTNKD